MEQFQKESKLTGKNVWSSILNCQACLSTVYCVFCTSFVVPAGVMGTETHISNLIIIDFNS